MLSTALPESVALTDWEVSSPSVGALPVRVPGTAAAALRAAGLWSPGEPRDFDAEDWTFRSTFAAGDGHELLRFGGIATVAEVLLNGEPILRSESMFLEHVVDVGALLREGENELEIRCRALGPLLRQRRTPRARWRTRIAEGNLRWFRTMLLGRAPGFAPGPAAVGPWRPVTVERGRCFDLRLRARLRGDDGVLAVEGSAPEAAEIELAGHRARFGEELVVPDVARWWPHTHGEPSLHEARLVLADGTGIPVGRVGFRELEFGGDGLDLRVNGVPVFVRGAVWTPVDLVSLAPTRDDLRDAIEQARDAGMNMLRVPGIGAYESDDFHDLCDELGMLVWQDFMFANMDYPIGDDGFRALVEREARQELARVAGRPSLAVVCGNSEVEQQVAMLGLDPALGRGGLFGELLPALVRESGVDATYLPSAPSGGELPFRTDRGVANYFGVGGYRRPLSDARVANVRFASECLAFANLPDDPPFEPVPEDVGSDWDFADVREHYRALLYGERSDDGVARAVTGEVMAEVFGEWRRTGSPCRGALVLWLRDVIPGAGWGVVDHLGRAKVALHHLRRVLAPVAVWTTDEGLNGIDVHVVNDRAEPLSARLRVALYRDFEVRVDGAEQDVELPPHGSMTRNVEAMLGRFVDASYAYRFGPPGHDLVLASLERDGEPLSQAFRFPVRRPPLVDDIGLDVSLAGEVLVVRTRALAHGVRIVAPGCLPEDDAFDVEPGGTRRVALRGAPAHATVTALNLRGSIEAAR
jgi:beta-mannosidase